MQRDSDFFLRFGDNGSSFFIGVVEDRNDPMMNGRIRARIFGVHSADRTEVPTEALPWASVMMPANLASLSGIGAPPPGLIEGTWVIGFFLDGISCQDPVILGGLPSIAPPNFAGAATQSASEEQQSNYSSTASSGDTTSTAETQSNLEGATDETVAELKKEDTTKEISNSMKEAAEGAGLTDLDNSIDPHTEPDKLAEAVKTTTEAMTSKMSSKITEIVSEKYGMDSSKVQTMVEPLVKKVSQERISSRITDAFFDRKNKKTAFDEQKKWNFNYKGTSEAAQPAEIMATSNDGSYSYKGTDGKVYYKDADGTIYGTKETSEGVYEWDESTKISSASSATSSSATGGAGSGGTAGSAAPTPANILITSNDGSYTYEATDGQIYHAEANGEVYSTKKEADGSNSWDTGDKSTLVSSSANQDSNKEDRWNFKYKGESEKSENANETNSKLSDTNIDIVDSIEDICNKITTETISRFCEEFSNEIKTKNELVTGSSAVSALMNFPSGISSVSDITSSVTDSITNGITDKISSAISSIGLDSILSNVSQSFSGISNLVSNVSSIVDIASDGVSVLQELADNGISSLTDELKNAINTNLLDDLSSKIKDTIGDTIAEKIEETGGLSTDELSDLSSTVQDKIKNYIKEQLGEDASELLSIGEDGVISFDFSELADNAMSSFSSTLSKISELGGMANVIAEAPMEFLGSSILDSVSSMTSSVSEFSNSFMSDLFDSMDPIQNLSDNIFGAVFSPVIAFKNTNLFGELSPDILNDITTAAKGSNIFDSVDEITKVPTSVSFGDIFRGVFPGNGSYTRPMANNVRYPSESDISRESRGDSSVNAPGGMAYEYDKNRDPVLNEPEMHYAPVYPYNKHNRTESGHVQEFDDTPGFERVQIKHRTGTGYHINSDGSQKTYTAASHYVEVEQNYEKHVKGQMTLVVDGGSNITIAGPSNINIEDDCNISSPGNLKIGAAGDIDINCKGAFRVDAAQSIILNADVGVELYTVRNIKLIAGERLNLEAHSDVTLVSDTGPIDVSARQNLTMNCEGEMEIISSAGSKIGTGGFMEIGAEEVDIGTVVNLGAGGPMFPTLLKIKPRKPKRPAPFIEESTKAVSSASVSRQKYEGMDSEGSYADAGEYTRSLSDGSMSRDELRSYGSSSPTVYSESSDCMPTQSGGDFSSVQIPSNIDQKIRDGSIYMIQVSPNFVLGDFMQNCYFKYKIVKSSCGTGIVDLIKNLSHLANVFAEPLLRRHGGTANNSNYGIKKSKGPFLITCGLRTGSCSGKHPLGRAMDYQISGAPRSAYYNEACWLRDNIKGIDAIILEWANGHNPVLHCQINRTGTPRGILQSSFVRGKFVSGLRMK